MGVIYFPDIQGCLLREKLQLLRCAAFLVTATYNKYVPSGTGG